MKIRDYRNPDKEKVISLWLECGLVVASNNPESDIERKLSSGNGWFLVGDLDGEIISTCMIGYEGHRGWINYLAVSVDHQRRGYGKLMMEKAELLLDSIGCPKINLQIRRTNSQVIEFYKELGYLTDDVVGMGKRLSLDEPYIVE